MAKRIATCEYCGSTVTVIGRDEGICDAYPRDCIHGNDVVGVDWVDVSPAFWEEN